MVLGRGETREARVKLRPRALGTRHEHAQQPIQQVEVGLIRGRSRGFGVADPAQNGRVRIEVLVVAEHVLELAQAPARGAELGVRIGAGIEFQQVAQTLAAFAQIVQGFRPRGLGDPAALPDHAPVTAPE